MIDNLPEPPSPFSMAPPSGAVLPQKVDSVIVSRPELPLPLATAPPWQKALLPENVERAMVAVPVPRYPLTRAAPTQAELPENVESVTVSVPPGPFWMAPPSCGEKLSTKSESATVSMARASLVIPPADVDASPYPSWKVRPLTTRCMFPTLRIPCLPPPSRIGVCTPGAASMTTGSEAEVPEVAMENPEEPAE